MSLAMSPEGTSMASGGFPQASGGTADQNPYAALAGTAGPAAYNLSGQAYQPNVQALTPGLQQANQQFQQQAPQAQMAMDQLAPQPLQAPGPIVPMQPLSGLSSAPLQSTPQPIVGAGSVLNNMPYVTPGGRTQGLNNDQLQQAQKFMSQFPGMSPQQSAVVQKQIVMHPEIYLRPPAPPPTINPNFAQKAAYTVPGGAAKITPQLPRLQPLPTAQNRQQVMNYNTARPTAFTRPTGRR